MKPVKRDGFDAPAFLADHGMAPTPRRAAVVQALASAHAPATAAEILAAARRLVELNRVTVYRILDELVSRGGARKIPGAEGKAGRFEIAPAGSVGPHPHAACRSCGGMECLRPVNLSAVSDSAGRLGFAIDRVSILVEGVCDQCRGR